MHLTKNYLRWSFAILALFGLNRCGGGKKTESAKASFEIVPEKPIVITANTLVNGSPVTAPWVKFNVILTNGSSRPITIIAVTAKIYAPNLTDGTAWAEDPASQASTVDTTECTYTTYGTFNPNETKALELPGVDACKHSPHPFYVGGLKTTANNTNYRYRIVLKPLGWFGTESVPEDRFDGQVTFTTQ